MLDIRTADGCRYGTFAYHGQDRFLGACLRIYGEWSEGEVDVYRELLRPTDITVEVGANVGALSVPLSRYCLKVYAFEPHPDNFQLLTTNLRANKVLNVRPYCLALGESEGCVQMQTLAELDAAHGIIGDYGGFEVGVGSITTDQRKLDDIVLNGRVAFMKMDCEGSELSVLKGAAKTIARDQPILYMENDRKEKSAPLVAWLTKAGYQCFWHRPPLFRADNFKRYHHNIFGDCQSNNMLCYPAGYRGHFIPWITDRVESGTR